MEINIDQVLYVLQTRGIGNTQLMIDGVANYNLPFYVIAPNLQIAGYISNKSNNSNARFISMYDTEKLLGSLHPVVADHTVWNYILKYKQEEIQSLKYEIQDLQLKVLELEMELDAID